MFGSGDFRMDADVSVRRMSSLSDGVWFLIRTQPKFSTASALPAYLIGCQRSARLVNVTERGFAICSAFACGARDRHRAPLDGCLPMRPNATRRVRGSSERA